MEPVDRAEREQLLRRAVLAGDERAWHALYQETFDDLYGYVQWRCGGRRDWADEIVQDTWLTAVRRIRRFDPQQGRFLAWLRGIAANLLRNHLRRQRKWSRTQHSANGQALAGSGDSQREDRQRQERVAAALDALSDREEAVLRAKYLEGRSVAEIAAAGGETIKAIESLLSRARQAFREVYREEGDEHAREQNDSPYDPLEAALGYAVRQPAGDANLRGAVLAQTLGVMRGRRRLKRCVLAAGLLGCYLAGMTTTGLWRQAVPQAPQTVTQQQTTSKPRRVSRPARRLGPPVLTRIKWP